MNKGNTFGYGSAHVVNVPEPPRSAEDLLFKVNASGRRLLRKQERSRLMGENAALRDGAVRLLRQMSG